MNLERISRQLREKHNWQQNWLNTVRLITQETNYHVSLSDTTKMFIYLSIRDREYMGNITNWFISWKPVSFFENGDCITYWLVDQVNDTIIAVFDDEFNEIEGNF